MRKIGTTKKGGAAGDNIQQQLEGLLGSGASRRKPPKWLWFGVGGGVLGGIWFSNYCQNCLTLPSRDYRLYITPTTYI